MAPERAEDLVYMHTDRLLSRNTSQYNGERHMWDLDGDGLEIFEGPDILEVANFPLMN